MRAFTLIELVAVLTLVVMLSAAAMSLSLSGAARAARLEDAVQQTLAFDSAARQLARAAGRTIQIVADLPGQRIRRLDPDSELAHGRDLAFDRDVRIDEVMCLGRRPAAGVTTIPVNFEGQSATYIMKLTDGRRSRWLMVIGLTGQGLELADETEVQHILRFTQATRRDAD